MYEFIIFNCRHEFVNYNIFKSSFLLVVAKVVCVVLIVVHVRTHTRTRI